MYRTDEVVTIRRCIYWVTGAHEDWFVIAESRKEAEFFYATTIGIEMEEAQKSCFAEEVCEIDSVEISMTELNKRKQSNADKNEADFQYELKEDNITDEAEIKKK